MYGWIMKEHGVPDSLLTVIEPDYNVKGKWIVECECGKRFSAWGYNVKGGRTRSCGCLRKKPYKNLINKKFKKLTVLDIIDIDKHSHYKYLCRCDCGNITEVWGTHLIEGDTGSCGHCNTSE